MRNAELLVCLWNPYKFLKFFKQSLWLEAIISTDLVLTDFLPIAITLAQIYLYAKVVLALLNLLVSCLPTYVSKQQGWGFRSAGNWQLISFMW